MRIKLSELTPKRLAEAIGRRLTQIPDIYAWKYSGQGKQNRQQLELWRNRYAGKTIFLIANGPSLKKMNLRPLKNHLTMGMNRIYLLKEELDFLPSFYIVMNELVIDQFSHDINQLAIPKFINWNRRNLFGNPSNDLSYFRYRLSVNDEFSPEIPQFLDAGGTVTFAALQILYFLGFTKVILIGLDHNFEEKGTPNKTEVRTQEKDESHFHPDYFPKGFKWQLPDLFRSELAYAKARQAYEADGRQILDATIDGKCTIFPKVQFEDFI